MDSPEKPRPDSGERAGPKDDSLSEGATSNRPASKRDVNLLFLFQSAGFRSFLLRIEQMLQGLPICKDLFCIIRPTSTWNRLAAGRRSAGVVFFFYLLPMILLVALVEGHGLILRGRAEVAEGMFNRFTFPKVFIYESASCLLGLLLILAAAMFIKSLANAHHLRNHLGQSLTVMFYAIGPMYLVQLFNGFPHMYLWVTWLAGALLTIGALYNCLPRIMEPDPPSAMGLFIGSASVVFLLTLGGRLLTGFYLHGNFKSLERFLSNLVARIFS
jgi:hypothetical protein